MRWVKLNKKNVPMDGKYICKISSKGEIFRCELELFAGMWVVSNEEDEVIEYLDETEIELEKVERDDEFWKEIILNEDGSVNVEQVYKELSDYSHMLKHVPIVYMHITKNTLSKPMYTAEQVTSLADQCYSEEYYETITEFLDQMVDEEIISNKLGEQLKSHLPNHI